MGVHVRCEIVRESLSARLDGEATELPEAVTAAHLQGCAACRGWQLQAERLTRVLRIHEVPEESPQTAGFGDRLAARTRVGIGARLRRVSRRWEVPTARIGLAVIGVVQLLVTALGMIGNEHGGHDMAGMATHLFNESSAWNLALGAGFVVAAAMPRLAAGLLPTLLFFLMVLAAVSIWDLARGDATTARVASHALVLAGALLLVAVNRTHERPGPSTTRRRSDDIVLLGATGPDDDILSFDEDIDRRDLPPTGRRTA